MDTAVLAHRKQSKGGQRVRKTATDLGRASYIVSMSGVAVAAVVVIVVLVIVSRQFVNVVWVLQS